MTLILWKIIIVSIVLLEAIIGAYLGLRVLKLKKRVELLWTDRNELIEERSKQSNKLRLKGIEMDEANKERCSDIMFRTIKEGDKVIGELLSKIERQLIIAALNVPEYSNTIKDPKTSFQMRKIYRELKEKIKDSLKD